MNSSVDANILNALDYFPKYLLFNAEGNTSIRTLIHVMSVYEIDTVRQRFECKLYIQMRWVISKFNIPPGLEDEELWIPEIEFVNCMGDIRYVSKTLETIELDPNFKEVIMTQIVQGRFYERFEVNNFPFDVQSLQVYMCLQNCPHSIILSNNRHSLDTIRKTGKVGHFIVQDDQSSASTESNKMTTTSPMMNHVLLEYDELELPGKIDIFNCGAMVYKENLVQSDCWKLVNANNVLMRQGKTLATRHDKGISFTTVRLVMTLERKYGFFFWNIILPTCILVNLSFVSFLLAPSELVNRFTITVTLILTMIAVKFTVSQYLPPTNYLTILDKYVVLSFMTLSAVAGQNILAYVVHETQDENKYFNIASGSLIILIWCFFNMIQFLLYYPRYRRWFFEKFVKQKIDDPLVSLEHVVPSVYKYIRKS